MTMQALGERELADAARRLAAERVLVLSGAGVSAESGVPAARAPGAFVVEVNPDETPLTPIAHASLRGHAAVMVPVLVGTA